MDRKAILAKVKGFVEEHFAVESGNKIKEDTSLIDSGIIDSTGILELVTFLEESFKFSVADEELVRDNLDSLDKLANFVSRKVSAE